MKIIIVLVALFIIIPIAKAFFGNAGGLVAFLAILSIPVFIDIKKSSFKYGIRDKIIFSILTILCTPLAYAILNYGHKTNLTIKEKSTLRKIEKYSIWFLVFIISMLGFVTAVEPNLFGGQFLIIMGITLLGVLFFHGLYPQHWELYEKNQNKNDTDSIFLLS